MPRFTLKQLLAGVLLGCVYLAVLKEVFIGMSHDAVSIVGWVIFTIFYFRLQLYRTLAVHGIFPVAVCPTVLLFLVSDHASDLSLYLQTFQALVDFCRGISIVTFPMALLILLTRNFRKRPSPC